MRGRRAGSDRDQQWLSIPPERIATVRKAHPGTPLLWTEIYPAWYRVWGGRAIRAGDGKSMAGGVLDFISRGGSGINYYPWHGGTNFGRNSMYLQTTSYDFSAPLDEYGSVTATGIYLGRLHDVLQEHSKTLLEGERTETIKDAKRTVTWRQANEEIQLIQDIHEPQGPRQGFPPRQAKSARLLSASGEVLFDVDATRETVARSFAVSEWKPVAQPDGRPLTWQAWDEPTPAERHDKGIVSVEPVEQLSLTKDSTDYCWYSTTLQVAQAGAQEIVILFGADFFYLYVDGHLVGTSTLPLSEDRGAITPDDSDHPRIVANISENGHPHGFQHSFALPQLTTGPHRIALLATALGMIKGDWQIASPMNFERKGIWEGVQCNGKPLQNWTMRPGLVGEQHKLPAHAANVSWRVASDSRPLRWHKTRLQVPENLLRSPAVFRLDAAGLGKGMIWVNGRAVGRHWLIPARSPADTPSQRYYHVPAAWMLAVNEIVILEEQQASPATVQLQVRA